MIKKQIGYRPNIQYQDEYESDASNVFNDINNEVPESNNNSVNDLIEQIEITNGLINKLPNGASEAIKEIIDQILEFIENELIDKEYEDIPDEWDWSYDDTINNEIPNSNSPDSDEEYDEEDFWQDVDEFPITKEEHEKTEIIEKEYVKNLVDLFEDYFTNLHTSLSTIWTNLIIAITNKPRNEINVVLNNILLNSNEIKNDSKHLLDSAIRTQIIKDIKFKYFQNLFNAEETISHLKQFKATYELRKRYAAIEEVNPKTFSDQMNNNILKNMQLTYDKKYDIAYENLYRYLRSSNNVLDDIFKTWVAEIKSKQTLIERKGVKK